MSTMSWSVLRETVVACVDGNDVIHYREIRTGRFVHVHEVFKKHLLDNLVCDQMVYDNQHEEDNMVQRVDGSEWHGYGYLNMEEDTDGDDTQVLIGAGQEVNTQEEAQDDLQGKANYWWNSIENRIQALLSMDTPWSLEKADSLVQWRDKVSTKTENGDNPTPMAAWLQWSEEAGPNWMATGHTDSEEKWEHGKTEYDDYFTAEGETRDVSYNKMPNGLFRPDRHWAKRNSKARFVIGKFMSQVKEIVSKKEMSNTEKNWKIGNLMHKTIVSCYDKQWSIGDFKGYLHGTGCSSLKWEGAWLRTDVLLRSIVFWVTKNKDLSYSWKGNNGEMAWSNGQPVKNKFSDKIGELYNLKGFVPLQDFLKNDCMGYYLMK